MHQPTIERIDEQVKTLACLNALDQQLVRRRNQRSLGLQLQNAFHRLHFDARIDARARLLQLVAHGEREFGREGHARPLPARYGAGRRLRLPHPRRQVLHANELQRAAGEDEPILRLQSRDETLLDRTQASARQKTHRQRGVTDDRADTHLVTLDDARVIHEVVPVFVGHPRILRIRAQGRTTACDEVEHPIQLRIRQRAIRPRRPQLGHHRIACEATTDRARHEVLRQQVEWPIHRIATLDLAQCDRVTRGGDLDELERMRRHTHDRRHASR